MNSPDTPATKSTSSVLGRRSLLGIAGGMALAGTASAASASKPTTAGRTPPRSTGFAKFQWLGTAGWRVDTATTTVLVDPYLSRFDTGLAAGRFDSATPLKLDSTAIDSALGAPGTEGASVDAIFVTHTHWDHFADVPHIAKARGRGDLETMVYATLSGYHLGQAMGLPSSQLAVVKGGEELNIGDVVVRVVRSLHSRTGRGGLLFPGLRTDVPKPPETIADMPEGDTLGFVVRRPDHSGGILLLGASDYDDQSLRGLDVDAVALPLPSNDVTAGYVARLLRALDRPRTVILVHWDNFESPLRNPPSTDDVSERRLRAITAEIERVSPRTRVLRPTYLTPMSLL